MPGLTVRDLLAACNNLVRRGYGDRTVMLSNDDEGNGYHTMYYTFSTDETLLEDIVAEGLLHDDGYNADDIVILG